MGIKFQVIYLANIESVYNFNYPIYRWQRKVVWEGITETAGWNNSHAAAAAAGDDENKYILSFFMKKTLFYILYMY